MPHPILKILLEYLNKTNKLGNGDILFIELLKKLVDEIGILLDSGIKPKRISDTLEDIKLYEKKDTGRITYKQLTEYVESMLKDSHISNLLVEAIEYTDSFDVENIRICKVQSGSTEDSYRTEGMLLNRLPEGRIKRMTNTSVGIFNCPFDIVRTEMKGTILMQTSQELLNFSNDEIELCKKAVDALNVNVIIFSGTVSDLFIDFADSRNILLLRVFNKWDMKRLCDLLGGRIYNNLGPIESKGFVEKIEVVEDAECKFTKIVSAGKVTTIVLKNSIKEMNDEMERKIIKTLHSLHYSNSVVSNDEKNTVEELKFTNEKSFEEIALKIGSDDVIRSKISEVVRKMKFEKMILSHQQKCVKYAFEFISTILEIDDYLVAKADKLDIKPRENPNWDDE